MRKFFEAARIAACTGFLYYPMLAQAQAPQPDDIERHALVIANVNYSEKLSAAKIDGEKIAGMLRNGKDGKDGKDSKGFIVQGDKAIGVANKADFYLQWNEFLGSLTKSGVAVFYFSGHGAEVSGDSVLLPTDIPLDQASEIRLRNEGISLKALFDEFQKRQQELQQQHINVQGVFIIDACRTPPQKEAAGTKGVNNSVDGKPLAVPIAPPSGILALYATSANQVAHSKLPHEEDGKEASVFTRTLVRLQTSDDKDVNCDATNGCSLQALARLVSWDVYLAVESAYAGEQPQTPVYFDAIPAPPGKLTTLWGARVDRVDNIANKASTLSDKMAASGNTYQLDPGREFRECEECPEMVVVEAGKFKMGEKGKGSRERSSNPAGPEDPRLDVTIAEKFAIGITDVTVGQYRACIADKREDYRCDGRLVPETAPPQLPVTDVSWVDAQKYVKWLNDKLSVGADPKRGSYRLPTEAEWEYAARAKSTGPYTFVGDARTLCEYGNGADQQLFQLVMANNRCSDGHGREAAQVKSYKKNDFGLYDVHGNVWKWMADCWSPTLGPEKARGEATGGDPACRHVAKGGSWLSDADALRLSNRVSFAPDTKRPTLGFRVVRALPKS